MTACTCVQASDRSYSTSDGFTIALVFTIVATDEPEINA